MLGKGGWREHSWLTVIQVWGCGCVGCVISRPGSRMVSWSGSAGWMASAEQLRYFVIGGSAEWRSRFEEEGRYEDARQLWCCGVEVVMIGGSEWMWKPVSFNFSYKQANKRGSDSVMTVLVNNTKHVPLVTECGEIFPVLKLPCTLTIGDVLPAWKAS